jgi:hypothetical protein
MTIDEKKVFQLKKELNEFLRENPKGREFQKKIDAELAKAGNQHNRLNVIFGMMVESYTELVKNIKKLREESERLEKLANQSKKSEK